MIWMVNTEWFAILKSGDLEAIESFFDKKWYIALLITFLLMFLQNMFTVIPLIIIVTINIFLYEFMLGFVWSWLTSIAGSVLAFFLYRYWLHSILTKKINVELKEKIDKNGLYYVFFARLIPFIPSSFINMAAGASSIRFSYYLGATLLGNMIYMLLMSFLVYGLITADIEIYLILISLTVFIPLIYLYKWKKNQINHKKRIVSKK
ncbi:TVP38/TMEM64 family protein [Pseudogracilibacillus auburnensis]|uniref:TVP38/TMEM64 family protein n=1 Tax=Pseudogracilibacillus auburnensis TaxID=1494959 RepID=UPI001A966D0F|nr:VTT domain-containing protein [Pseudogracilibacillus auburnensis]MBO1004021.1 TVP38/TMEM64 family protein [Pseudogracilibacillus auburnensis]